MVKLNFYETIFRLFDLNWKDSHNAIEFDVDDVEAATYRLTHPNNGVIRYSPTLGVAYYNGTRFKARISW